MEDLKFIADQLRKPTGEFAIKIAEIMSEGNRPLYDLTLKTMEVQDNDTLLEIGFGSGTHFEDFVLLKKGLHVYGIDYSSEMVELAMKNNIELIETGQLKLGEGSSDDLPFDGRMFDSVYCNMVIYFWENPEEHLREIFRVLKPGGRFYTGMRTKASMLELSFTKFGFNLYSEAEWRTILEENNFSVIGTTHQTDPATEIEEEKIHLDSVCLIAEKE